MTKLSVLNFLDITSKIGIRFITIFFSTNDLFKFDHIFLSQQKLRKIILN